MDSASGSNELEEAVRSSVVAATTKANALVLPTKVGAFAASFAVDTGAAVNVLSQSSYEALKRFSRGGKWPLRSTEIRLKSVSSTPLTIQGVVSLPERLG